MVAGQEADGSTAKAPEGPVYVDATATTGLDFTHFNGATGEYHFPEIMGGGGALLDYDGDGDLDLFLVQGSVLARGGDPATAIFPPAAGSPLSDRLFRNDLAAPGGTPRFTDVSVEAGFAAAVEHGQGVAVADYDGDGHVDLYVTNAGPNRLWRNRGDGTFEDVTAKAGAGDGRWSVPATFLDADSDGDLDLFVGNYVDYAPAKNIPCTGNSGVRDYCGPSTYAAEPDRLLLNQGDGTFRDGTATAGLAAAFGPALGVVAGDFDGDGHPDLFVANDGAANQLWMGRGDGTFQDEALLRGVALNAAGQAEASMGIAAGDPDGDGDEDLFITHLRSETNTFYVNDGSGLFRDASAASGLAAPSQPRTGFGTAWTDHDLDGDLDLVVLNGAVLAVEGQRRAEATFPFAEPAQLFAREEPVTSQDGQRLPGARPSVPRFEEATSRLAPSLAEPVVGRALLVGDLDNDGDEDLVLVANSGPARVLLNTAISADRPGAGRWIGLRLLLPASGDSPPRDALGAVVTVRAPGMEPRVRRVRTDGSYAAGRDPRIVLALVPTVRKEPEAKAAGVQVEVVWPDGKRETWADLEPGRYHQLMAGRGDDPTDAGGSP